MTNCLPAIQVKYRRKSNKYKTRGEINKAKIGLMFILAAIAITLLADAKSMITLYFVLIAAWFVVKCTYK